MSKDLAVQQDPGEHIKAILTKFGEKYPEESKDLEEYVARVRSKDIAVLGEDETFALRDSQGEIRSYKSKVTFSIKDGTITKLTDKGNTLYYNSKAMEIWERESGTFLLRPASDGRMILSGVTNNNILKEVIKDQVWITDIQLTPTRKFWLPKEYAGYRVDQILTSHMQFIEMDEIKE